MHAQGVARAGFTVACAAVFGIALSPAAAAPPRHDYPTSARVEFVQECMFRQGGEAAYLYKCSCVLDRIADELDYDDFVEASTYTRNARLGGEAGAIFRDPVRGKQLTRMLRELEERAFRECGIPVGAQAGS